MDKCVLIIDDEESLAWGLRKACERQGYGAIVAASAEDGLTKAALHRPVVIFLDVRLPGMDGLTALAKLRKVAPGAAIIVITAHGNLSTAVKAVEGGAFDYLSKPFDLEQATAAVQRAVARSIPETASPPPSLDGEEEMVGKCLAIQSVYKRIALVAPTDTCVLITGESGTGKELVARALHVNSPRRNKPFLPIHVASLNPNLVESELFGHVRGAFTGADRAHPGLLALADGGTVFLDELGDIPLPVQAKLLRVLERQEVLPVGGAHAQKVDVRIVSATNADLGAAVAEGTFRHDLFFRLNVYPIALPALRDRLDDLPILAEHFLSRLTQDNRRSVLTPDATELLCSRPWPGNIRELKNALEHAAIEARGGPIRPEHLPPSGPVAGVQLLNDRFAALVREWIRNRVAQTDGVEPSGLHAALLAELEPVLLAEVLEQVHGNRLAAGRWLGLARATVRKMIRRYQVVNDLAGEDGDETDAE